jgi:hypothetical protein
MRKIILVAAMVLASASAQAAGSRSLTLASAEQAWQATTAPQAAEPAGPTDAPAYVDRPSAVSTTPAATTPTPATAAPTNKTTAKADKPKHRRDWTEDRIISELHRHGIYW